VKKEKEERNISGKAARKDRSASIAGQEAIIIIPSFNESCNISSVFRRQIMLGLMKCLPN